MIKIPSKVFVGNEEDTCRLASEFISDIKAGERIILNGELGAGKTFFIKAALSSIGVENANSPSFAIVNEYSGNIRYLHFDFYRIKNLEELYDIGWQEYISDEEAVMFVEWGNLIPVALPKKRIEINIETKNITGREYSFTKYE